MDEDEDYWARDRGLSSSHPVDCLACGGTQGKKDGHGSERYGENIEAHCDVPPECEGCSGTGQAVTHELEYQVDKRMSGRAQPGDPDAGVVIPWLTTCAACQGQGYRDREAERVNPRFDPFQEASTYAPVRFGWDATSSALQRRGTRTNRARRQS